MFGSKAARHGAELSGLKAASRCLTVGIPGRADGEQSEENATFLAVTFPFSSRSSLPAGQLSHFGKVKDREGSFFSPPPCPWY